MVKNMSQAAKFSETMQQWGASIASSHATVSPVENIYMVFVTMSSPNQTLSTEWTDASKMQALVNYKLTLEQRRAISAVRARYNVAVQDECVSFMGMPVYICKESQIAGDGDNAVYTEQDLLGYTKSDGKRVPARHPDAWGISKRINYAANLCMKKIHPALHARVEFVKIDEKDSKSAAMYNKVVASIRGQIYGDLFKRLQDVINLNREKMLPQTKKSLLSQIESIKKVNILNDAEVNAELDRFKAIVETELIEPLAAELDAGMNLLHSRYGMMRGGLE